MSNSSDKYIERFKAWMVEQGFADQTMSGGLVQFRRILAHANLEADPKELALPHLRTHLLRIEAVGEEIKLPKEVREHAAAALAILRKPRGSGIRGGRKAKVRKRTAQSVDDTTWPKLITALEKSEVPESAVLLLEGQTGLRVGDVLRISPAALLAGRKAGRVTLTAKGGRDRVMHFDGAARAWQKLVELVEKTPGAKSMPNIARVLSSSDDTSSSGAAYKACWRLLKSLEEELGTDRLHTHRLRRTMAVQALRVTQDVATVGQLLGHAPGSNATLSYVDEARSEDVARLSKKVNDQFAKGRKP